MDIESWWSAIRALDLQAWLSIIGAVSGVSGFLLAVAAHRQSNSLARTNVLHDVEVAHDKAARSAAGLLDLLPQALGSRKGVFSLRGHSGRSSRLELFVAENAADKTTAEALKSQLAAFEPTRFARMSYKELMKQLTALRKIEGEVGDLTQKYEGWLAHDTSERDHVLADRRAAGPPSRESGVHRGPRD